MPTAYTAGIEDGTITNAKDFLMLCARNFGACVSMRDEPLSAPIPEKFIPNCTWYRENIEIEQKKLEKLLKMSPEEIKAYRESKRRADEEHVKQARASEENILRRYQKMLKQVESWIPPTSEHENLKAFAIEQINMCLPDLSIYTIKSDDTTDEQWLKDNLICCMDIIRRYKDRISEEIKAAESRTTWVKALRDSF